MHSARLSTRWSRHSQLSNEDWREGGMGTPLVRDFPLPPTTLTNDFGFDTAPAPPSSRKSFRRSIRNSWRSSIMGGGSTPRHRWSILSASSPAPSSIPPPAIPETQPTPVLRKRKRWSNAIGSTTTTFVGNVRSSWGGSFHAPSSAFSETEMAAPEVEVKRQKGRKRGRFLYGMAMSFGGLGAAGRVVG